MCGRFAITLPNDAMAQAFAATPANDLPPVPRFNICPTQPVPAVISRDGTRHMGPMRWGFLPHWYKTPTDGPLLINARAESIAEKPAFREAVRARRCLIPASGFYEWAIDAQGEKHPWHIAPATGELLAFAGIWQIWKTETQRQVTCAIVTCAATPQMAELHHRMPVIIAPEDWALWLGEAGHGAARLLAPERQATPLEMRRTTSRLFARR